MFNRVANATTRLHASDVFILLRICTFLFNEGIVVSFEDFLAQYGKAKSEIEVLEGWQNAIPMKIASYQEALTKYRIQLGLAMLANKNSTPSLRIQVKPTKSLFAEASFPSGKLCLIPETTRITATQAARCPPGSP